MKTISRSQVITILSIFIPFACYILFCLTGNMYTYTDNLTVAVVAGGMYGANNFCQYLHPLYCLIIRVLNPIFPTADVFTLLTHFYLLFGASLLTHIALSSAIQIKRLREWQLEDMILCALLLLAIVYMLQGMYLFGVNYTVQTAAIISMGLIVLKYARTTVNKSFFVISGTVLVCAGYMMRLEAALIFIPFVMLDLIVDYLLVSDKKKQFTVDLRSIFPCIIIVIILLLSKVAFNSFEPYKTDSQYNQYRTIAEDYWMSGYDRHKPVFEEIDEITYNSAKNWILLDTDRINAESLKQIAEAGSDSAYTPKLESMRYVLRAMWRRIRNEDLHLLILFILTSLLCIWNIIQSRSIWLKLESLFAFLGGFIILFYFTFMGRAPMRVWQCVMLAAITVFIIVMIKNASDNDVIPQEKQRLSIKNQNIKQYKSIVPSMFALFLCVILYFGIGQVMAYAKFHEFQTPLTSKIGADDSAYYMTFADDALYMWSGWHATIPDHFAKQNKLPTQRVIDHNIAVGDWVYGQQYFNEFLERIDAKNPAIALLERPNTYIMEGQVDDVVEYLNEHYNADITKEYAWRVNKKRAYRIVENRED